MFAFMIGIATGIVIAILVVTLFKTKPSGFLRIDHSDPNEPLYLFLELTEDMSSVLSKETVVFRVKVKDYIPHE